MKKSSKMKHEKKFKNQTWNKVQKSNMKKSSKMKHEKKFKNETWKKVQKWNENDKHKQFRKTKASQFLFIKK